MNSRMGVCASRRALKGVCPSMTTCKDKKMDQAMRKFTKDLMNSRMGVCPNVR